MGFESAPQLQFVPGRKSKSHDSWAHSRARECWIQIGAKFCFLKRTISWVNLRCNVSVVYRWKAKSHNKQTQELESKLSLSYQGETIYLDIFSANQTRGKEGEVQGKRSQGVSTLLKVAGKIDCFVVYFDRQRIERTAMGRRWWSGECCLLRYCREWYHFEFAGDMWQ